MGLWALVEISVRPACDVMALEGVEQGGEGHDFWTHTLATVPGTDILGAQDQLGSKLGCHCNSSGER